MIGGIAVGLVGGAAAGQAVVADELKGLPPHWSQEVSWLAKALGASGYAKYRPLLERVAEIDALSTGGHANAALDGLETSARWNRIINDPANHAPEQTHEAIRMINALRSGEQRLQRNALDRAVHLNQPALFDVIEAEFKRKYKEPLDDAQNDTVAVMAKVLARNGGAKYRATLADAKANASTFEVRQAAKRMVYEIDSKPKRRHP